MWNVSGVLGKILRGSIQKLKILSAEIQAGISAPEGGTVVHGLHGVYHLLEARLTPYLTTLTLYSLVDFWHPHISRVA